MPSIALQAHPNAHRILHIHANKPGVLSEINTLLSKNKINILGQYLSTNDTIGYVVLDLDKKLSAKAVELLKGVKGTIKVRTVY
ncbi:phosphoglycerate dehydrogenase [Arachidicoccus ginsenosidivorans]